MLTVGILVGTWFVVIILDHFQRLRKFKWLDQFDGPSPTFPLVGNSLQFVGHPSRYGGIFLSNFNDFGVTYKLWQMRKPTLVTADPKLVKIILSSSNHLQKHASYESTIKCVLGNGLITSDVDQWKSDRKLLNRYFNLELFGSSFKLCLNNLSALEHEINASENKPVKCRKYFTKIFLTILMQTFTSNPSLMTERYVCEIEDQIINALDVLNVRITRPWTKIPLYWKLSGYERKLKRIHKDCAEMISKITDGHNITEEKFGVSTAHEKSVNGKNETEESNPGNESANKFQLLFTDKNIPWQWKYDHILTIFGAGVDTMSVAATMTLFFLALNPECQDKAQNEVDSMFSENETLNFRDISKMKYIRMCIKEAMRLHPPAPVVGRTTTEDILMEDGRKIPKGSSILILLQGLNLNPEQFPQPHQFDPERFSESNSPSVQPFTYIPFSGGPRNCIGQKYAETILPTMLSHVLRKFCVTTSQNSEDIKVLYEVAGTPYPEVELIFKRRSN